MCVAASASIGAVRGSRLPGTRTWEHIGPVLVQVLEKGKLFAQSHHLLLQVFVLLPLSLLPVSRMRKLVRKHILEQENTFCCH